MDSAHAKVLADREKLVAFHKRVEDQVAESAQKEQEQARRLQAGQRELALLEEARDRLHAIFGPRSKSRPAVAVSAGC